QDRATDGGVTTLAAAQVDLVRLLLALLPRLMPGGGSLQPNVCRPVMGTGMRAAVHVDLQGGDRGPEAGFEPLDDLPQLALCLGDRVVAQRLPGAADAVGADAVDVQGEADLLHPLEHGLQARLGDAGQDEVLLPGDAEVAAELLRQIGKRQELRAADQPQVDREADVDPTRLLLRVYADVVRLRGRLRCRRVLERAAQPRFHQAAHPGRAVVVHHELHPRLYPRDAVLQILAPNV